MHPQNPATLEIVEQPAELNGRFRYECERTAPIIGVNSSGSKKTCPSIRILNYTGAVIVIVSCVTKDMYRPHPHRLEGHPGCVKGVCKVSFETNQSEPKVVQFKNLGINFCKSADIEKSLDERKEIRVDPFKNGHVYKADKKRFFDNTALRLCFQAFLVPSLTNHANPRPLLPVVSEIIRDKKFYVQLAIVDMSDSSSPATGGKKIMLFCDKVSKDDIKIRFFRENGNGSLEWEAWAEFKRSNVHRTCGISFRTPPYARLDIDQPVDVYIQLVRPSDNCRSASIYFKYVPDYTSLHFIANTNRSKKRKIEASEEFGVYEVDHRHRPTMELNIVPNIEPDFNSDEGAASAISPVTESNFVPNVDCNVQSNLAPVSAISPVTESNFVSNVDCNVQSNLAQSYHHQQQNNSKILPSNDCYTQQINFNSHHSSSYAQHQQLDHQTNQFYHSRPLTSYNRCDYRPPTFQQPTGMNFREFPPSNIYPPQQQPHPPNRPNLPPMYTNHGGLNFSSACSSIPNLLQEEPGDLIDLIDFSATQNNGVTANQLQNFGGNIKLEDRENMKDSFDSYVLQPL